MSELLEYKCPCCGGAIGFDSSSQNMKCPFCNNEFEVEALKDYEQNLQREKESKDELTWQNSPHSEWQEEELQGLKIYNCKSCGGEIIGDDSLAATICPYCTSTVVMVGQVSGELRPDYVLPFKIDSETVKEMVLKYISRQRLAPKLFRNRQQIDEIKGVYVPFWLYNAEVKANIRFNATRVRTWEDKDNEYTETSYYLVTRAGDLDFARLPVDGSSKVPNDLTEALEPFDFKEMVDFQTAYLAGYLADKYDLSSGACKKRANQRIKTSTEASFASTVKNFSTVTVAHSDLKISNGLIDYALLPVWLLKVAWENKLYTIAVNGQSGEIVVELPLDKKAYWLQFAFWTLGIGVVALIIIVVLFILSL